MTTKSHPDDGRKQYEEALLNTVDVDPILKQLIERGKGTVAEFKRGIFTNTHYTYTLQPHQEEVLGVDIHMNLKEALLDYMEKNDLEYGAPIFSFEYDTSSNTRTDVNQDTSMDGILSVIPGMATISIESFSRAVKAGGQARYGVTIETPSRMVHLDFETADRNAVRALHTAIIGNMYSHPLDTMAGITEAVAFWNNPDLNPYSVYPLIEKDNRKK